MRAPDEGRPVWWNGEWVGADAARVGLSDPGLLAGIGVFETLGVERGTCIDLDAHLRRLADGARRLAVPLPERSGVEQALATEAARHRTGRAWVKVVATRAGNCGVFGGSVRRGACGPATAVLLRWRVDPRGPLVGLKTLNYAPSILGLEEARRHGADEGLWLNTRGHLAEGCASNLFVVQRGRLFTSGERDGILPGITRAAVLTAAHELGLQVHVGKLRLPRLAGAEEAFLTSSVAGVRPLVAVDGRAIGRGEPGPVTATLTERVLQARRATIATVRTASAVGSRAK